MTIVTQVEKTLKEHYENLYDRDNRYAPMDGKGFLEKEIIKPRGYSLQSLDERQKDILRNNTSYSVYK